MYTISIRRAEKADAEKLNAALMRLSDDIGDDHGASTEDLIRHGFGPSAAFHALLAEQGDSRSVVGVIVYSPVFSTVRASAGLYVSDLWVSGETRGSGLGKRLLAAALQAAPKDWTVGFLKLAVYEDNPSARAFYDRLGFSHDPNETYLTLAGSALKDLKETP
ncbi:GNAT family N-acetyltransferase [Roseibium aggregatum]|uniref:GNAT family N-acetyltransferase n=1 Tax=Roseibium aggregatum TaxID=187304 RepID=A0A926NYB9_9HYPH|nr:N-acetyltransferase [Roseibium aggregatum]MBD1545518.1 GNAT family N-acetyltransferase [Roseibium aggregatum]